MFENFCMSIVHIIRCLSVVKSLADSVRHTLTEDSTNCSMRHTTNAEPRLSSCTFRRRTSSWRMGCARISQSSLLFAACNRAGATSHSWSNQVLRATLLGPEPRQSTDRCLAKVGWQAQLHFRRIALPGAKTVSPIDFHVVLGRSSRMDSLTPKCSASFIKQLNCACLCAILFPS